MGSVVCHVRVPVWCSGARGARPLSRIKARSAPASPQSGCSRRDCSRRAYSALGAARTRTGRAAP